MAGAVYPLILFSDSRAIIATLPLQSVCIAAVAHEVQRVTPAQSRTDIASRFAASSVYSPSLPPPPSRPNITARDIQKWEYVPLGPFGAKNFATTISPWVVTLDALAPFVCATSSGLQTDPAPLPYLRDPAYGSYDVELEVSISAPGFPSPCVVSHSNFKHMYWNARQQLVHHTITGCRMRPGDLLGSGTISGPVSASVWVCGCVKWRNNM